MRRLSILAAMLAGASVASAQMPPSISKPIEQARKAAAATNTQMAVVNQESKPAAAKPTPATPAVAVPQTKGAQGATKSAQSQTAPASSAKNDMSKVTFYREVFAYVSEGRRDPFASPIETGEIRPLVADLRLTGIIFDATGRNSVAIMRDMSTQQQYRAKVGQLLGRARVTQIKPQEVGLSIEEYGFSRLETLKLNTQQTQQTKGKP